MIKLKPKQTQNHDAELRNANPYFRGRNRTVTVTFSLASEGTLSENEYGVLLRAEEDAGELRPSTEVSRNCFEDDVVEDVGEFAALEPLDRNPLDFALRFEAIAITPSHNSQTVQKQQVNSTKTLISY